LLKVIIGIPEPFPALGIPLGHQVQEKRDKEQDKINAERESVLFHEAAILLPANILEVPDNQKIFLHTVNNAFLLLLKDLQDDYLKQHPMKPSGKKAIEQEEKRNKRNRRLYAGFLGGIIILAFFLYSNSLSNEVLHFDDMEYFGAHPDVTHLSWQSIREFFSSYYLQMYQPLPVLTLSVNYYFSGMNPVPMHLFNLFFHLINILLVFRFVRMLTDNRLVALAVAFFFAIHPMNVEAVSWISARSSGMYTCFYLSALIFYLRYVREGLKIRDFLITILLFILSLFSKSQAITLPLLLVLVDWVYRRKLISRKVIFEKVPFLAFSLLFALIAIHNPGESNIAMKGMLANYSPLDDLFMVCWSFSFYIIKFFVPVGLCGAYVFPPKTGSLMPIEYYLSPLLLAAAGLFLYSFRRNRMMIAGFFLFIFTIFINIQVIPSRLVIVADRYGYFPYLGLMIMMAVYILSMTEKYPSTFRKYRTAGVAFILCYGVFFSVALVERNKVWANEYVFMSDMIAKNPPVPYLYRVYGTRGNWLKKHGRLDEAFDDFSKAISLRPDNPLPWVNRASLNIERRNFRDAISDAGMAIQLHYLTATVFQLRAAAKFFESDYSGALDDCNQSLKLDSTGTKVLELKNAILDSLEKKK
jgi:hypothetical protein